MKNIPLLFIVFILLVSCGGLSDAGKILRNEKVKSTDEFLVKKKNPLILPPDYEEIPKPGSISTKKQDEKEKIKKILKAPQVNNNSKNKTSSTEQTILKNIRK
tara:strand:- start:175 stop:483 length:309 start_codon:yes stop_codon:yes gene_type:complete